MTDLGWQGPEGAQGALARQPSLLELLLSRLGKNRLRAGIVIGQLVNAGAPAGDDSPSATQLGVLFLTLMPTLARTTAIAYAAAVVGCLVYRDG